MSKKNNKTTPNKRKKTSTSSHIQTFVGKLDISPQGMGYVAVKDLASDIKIKRENIKQALQGDTVEVALIKKSGTSQRVEGIVTKIIERGIKELIGTVQMNMNFAFVVPDGKNFSKDIFINEKNSQGLKTGDRVAVQIIRWDEHVKNPEGKIIEILNDARVNDIAMKDIILQKGFSLAFSAEVMQEVAAIPEQITTEEIQRRKDMRDIFTVTIDPHDAKDFDDAISFQKLNNGLFEVGVHIADVAHYVLPGTALDQEAFKRATSVYLPDRVIPMLPEKISNELCSLRPHEDKLTFSVIFVVNAKAEVQSYEIHKTVIHSNKRYTYEEVQSIIEGGNDEYASTILQLHNLSQQIRSAKFKSGAINFASEEVRFELDAAGIPIAVTVKESKACHQLIEELMLLANKTVAAHVHQIQFNQQPIPFPYRIHDTPDMDKLKTYAMFAEKYGFTFNLKSPETIAQSFNKMVVDSENHPEKSVLHALGIRTMAKAAYTTHNIGHYGLAFAYYCHFTSPIRRYPDVLVHRVLHECIQHAIKPIQNMEAMCAHCSERERAAMESERDANKYKQVEFMRKFIGDDFPAIISGVAKFGCWAQTTEHKCEGFIDVQDLREWDEFAFDEENYALVGKHTKQRIQIGQTVQVQVAGANLIKREIDFKLLM